MHTDRRAHVVRFLRIAVSGVCRIACVLLIALWVRSYNHRDVATLGIGNGPGYAVESVNGSLAFLFFQWRTGYVPKGWGGLTEASDFTFASRFQLAQFGAFGFKSLLPGMLIAVVPHWFPVAGFATLAILFWIPWIPWKFSLRTLWIATTLVAVVLGLAMWAAS